MPHVHFHIVPRPPIDFGNNSFDSGKSQTQTAAIVFGKGQRDDLDDDDAKRLVRALREELMVEIERVRNIEGIDLKTDFEATKSYNSDVKVKL